MKASLLATLTTLGFALVGQARTPAAPVKAQAPPVTGRAVKGMESFDRLMTSFIARHNVPGAALAVVRDGKIVYARGFGYADRDTRAPVGPGSLFRIASVSKPITSAAVMQLVERKDKKLRLGDRVFDILKLEPAGKGKVDPRLKGITVRQLLLHTGGWDRGKSFDPMFRPVRIAKALGAVPPAGPMHVARYMLTVSLDFDPGSRYAYSNFGYCLLGRIIEAKTNMTYEQYVRRHVLAPAGITRMRIGRTLPADRADGEVTYYTRTGLKGACVFAPNVGKRVPHPYGAWHLEAMDAHGGWIASAVDLVRFARQFDSPKTCKLLNAPSIAATFARPKGLAGYTKDRKPKAAYYAFGWMVRPVGKAGRANTWHAGSLPGTSSLLVRRHDGLDWAVLFNATRVARGPILAAAIDPLLHQAAAAVKAWPDTEVVESRRVPWQEADA